MLPEELEEHLVVDPVQALQPQDLAAGPDGAVWFDERGSAFALPAIGRVNAQFGVISEDPNVVQSGGWKPFALTFAPDGSYAYEDVLDDDELLEQPCAWSCECSHWSPE